MPIRSRQAGGLNDLSWPLLAFVLSHADRTEGPGFDGCGRKDASGSLPKRTGWGRDSKRAAGSRHQVPTCPPDSTAFWSGARRRRGAVGVAATVGRLSTPPVPAAMRPVRRRVHWVGSSGGQRADRVVLVDHATRQLFDRRHWTCRVELAAAIFEWIEGWYNPGRRHTSLGNRSPHEYESLTPSPSLRHDHHTKTVRETGSGAETRDRSGRRWNSHQTQR